MCDFSGIIETIGNQLFLHIHTHVVVQEHSTEEVNYTYTISRGWPTGI